MKIQTSSQQINWNRIIETPLDIPLAKLRAPRISDHNALNQIATALHEAIHFIYAVKHKSPVLFVAVATSPKGAAYPRVSNAKGFTADYLLSCSKGSVESYVAAAIFEVELDPRPDNAIASLEEELGLKAAQGIIKAALDRNPNDLGAMFTSNVGILEEAFNVVCHEFYGFFSPLIKTVAKAILFHRGKDGMVSINHTDQISQYIKAYLSEQLYDLHYHGGIESTIKWLSPAVKKQNDIEKKQYEKWMRENDIDTILAIYRQKQLDGINLKQNL